ncbi:MAG: aminotransferase class I/II-fold pyridoxal phosphate-dependent enzyme [Chloroflexi bacterium]|nr:aminotransferase class I/II-fold pyridoxal phosphate-dependent enzyme [Chloroflexota bacterium]
MQLTPFKLERYFARYEFNVKYLLCSSDCESLSVGDLLAFEPEADEGLKRHWLGYTESSGAPSLRQEISRIYTGIQPEQVLVHSGAEEAIFLFMHAMLQPGDHIIVHWPCYQSLFEIARSIGCEVTFWEARLQNEWALDLDELKRSLRPNTRAVIVNTPHNPTGTLMPQTDYRALNELVQERDLLLFSDEVYRELEYDPADRLPSACELNQSAVSLGVMSKTYGLAGLRIGWIATHNAPVYARMAALKDYTTICSSAPSEYLSELALRHRGQISGRNLQIIHDNLSLLDGFFSARADRFEWVRPKAGPIAFPRLIGEDVEQFCHQLVTNSGVLLLPGTMYDHPGNHFRLGFARKNMPQALAQLEQFLDHRPTTGSLP